MLILEFSFLLNKKSALLWIKRRHALKECYLILQPNLIWISFLDTTLKTFTCNQGRKKTVATIKSNVHGWIWHDCKIIANCLSITMMWLLLVDFTSSIVKSYYILICQTWSVKSHSGNFSQYSISFICNVLYWEMYFSSQSLKSNKKSWKTKTKIS